MFASFPTNATEYPDAGNYDIDKGATELRVLIHPAGLLKGMGHSHVISTSDIAGRIEIRDDPADFAVELTIPVERFEVDNDKMRAEEGDAFRKKVSEKDKRGTRKNMLGRKLLDSGNFSTMTVRSTRWSGELPDIVVTAEILVRDRINVLEFPATVDISDNKITVSGDIVVTHGKLGLKPFKAGFGTLRVRDEMKIRFRITARRVSDQQ